MINVGIVGATGYTGLVLMTCLLSHPQVQITYLAANRSAGKAIADVFPHLSGANLPQNLVAFNAKDIPKLDVLFLALPHGASHGVMADILNQDIGRIIDLSADFRLNDANVYKSTYGMDHALPDMLSKVPLGIPEIYRDDIRSARLVACPGCYSTSVIVGLYPLYHTGMTLDRVIVDSKSGVSGAGRQVSEANLFCEVNEAVTAYKTGVHRHVPEMEMVLGDTPLFSPHLVPMMRGILSSCYITFSPTAPPIDPSHLQAAYQQVYEHAPFVTVTNLKNGSMPSTRWVVGSNRVHITIGQVSLHEWVVFSAIDNLVKGAAGQAVQVLNVMNEWDETYGLQSIPRTI